MSPYRVVFEKHCHLPVKLEHRDLSAIKQLNFKLNKVGHLRKLQIFEIEELRNEAYATLEFLKVEPNFFMINPYIGKILSQDKRFCYTTLGSTSLPEN